MKSDIHTDVKYDKTTRCTPQTEGQDLEAIWVQITLSCHLAPSSDVRNRIILQSDIEVQAVNPPLPPPQQTPQPLQSQAGPLDPRPGRLVHGGRRQRANRRVEHVENHRRCAVWSTFHHHGAIICSSRGVDTMCRRRGVR